MDDQKKLVEKIFTEALQFEEKGFVMYEESAEKTTNPLGKATLQSLASDENEHREIIKRFMATLQAEDSPDLEKLIPVRAADHCLLPLSPEIEALKDQIAGDSDILEIFKIGMELESKGYSFYEKALGECQHADAQKLLAFLVAEEKRHFALLQNSYDYVRDPAAWYAADEERIFEG